MCFPQGLDQEQFKNNFILQNLNSPQQDFRLPKKAQHMRDYFSTTPQGLEFWKEHHNEATHTMPQDLESSTNNNEQSYRKMSSRYSTLPPAVQQQQSQQQQYYDNVSQRQQQQQQQQESEIIVDRDRTPPKYRYSAQKETGGAKYSQTNVTTPHTQLSSPQRIHTAYNQSIISNTVSSNFNTTCARTTTAAARSQNAPFATAKHSIVMSSTHYPQSSALPEVIYEQPYTPSANKKLNNLSINLPATALPQCRHKIPRELPLSSSPARNSYQIMKDKLRINFFKHNEFNPALLSNTNRQVLDGILDPEKPVVGSARSNRKKEDESPKKPVKKGKKSKKNNIEQLQNEEDSAKKKVRVSTALKQTSKRSSKLRGGRAGSLPQTKEEEKERRMLQIQQEMDEKPEGQTINDIIVQHGSYVKKYLSYEKPVFALFTGSRAPLMKKVSPQTTRRQKMNEKLAQQKTDKVHKDRLITSKFKQNQENSNLERIFHSKENSIKQFIKSRMKKFKPQIVSTHPFVRVAKQLTGSGKEMNKIAPRMRGVLETPSIPNKDSASFQKNNESIKRKQTGVLSSSPASMTLNAQEQRNISSPNPQVVNLSDDHANLLSQLNGTTASSKNSNYLYNSAKLNSTAKNKSAMSTTLPILFEQRHQPSEHDSIFNISIDGNGGGGGGGSGVSGGAGKMSIRKYNIEKRKVKIERQSEVKKIQDQRKKLIDQEKRKFIQQAFKDDDDFMLQMQDEQLSKSSKKKRILDSQKNRGSVSSSIAGAAITKQYSGSIKKSVATTSRKNSEIDIGGFRSTRQSPSPQTLQNDQKNASEQAGKLLQHQNQLERARLLQQRRQLHILKQQKAKKKKRKIQSMTQQQHSILKGRKNPIQELMKLVRKKSDKNLKVKQILAARNKIGRACRQMQAAVSSFLDNLNLQQDQYDREQTNLYDMMDQAHVRLQIEQGVRQGQNLRDIKEDTKNTHLFVNSLQSGSKKLWKPDKLRIGQQTLKIRTEQEANKALIFQPNQKTAAEKAPGVEIPALRDTNFEILEHSVKMT